jgi:hypothetical protein
MLVYLISDINLPFLFVVHEMMFNYSSTIELFYIMF